MHILTSGRSLSVVTGRTLRSAARDGAVQFSQWLHGAGDGLPGSAATVIFSTPWLVHSSMVWVADAVMARAMAAWPKPNWTNTARAAISASAVFVQGLRGRSIIGP